MRYIVHYTTPNGTQAQQTVEAPSANAAKNVAMLNDDDFDTCTMVVLVASHE